MSCTTPSRHPATSSSDTEQNVSAPGACVSATARVRAVADDGDQVAGEDVTCCSVTQSAPASPTKQHAGTSRRGLARLFRGKPASNDGAMPVATDLSFGWTAELLPRSSSAAQLTSAISVAAPDPGLYPTERRRGLGRLLGRKRAVEGAAESQQKDRYRSLPGVRKRHLKA